jgi:hypothetical protein
MDLQAGGRHAQVAFLVGVGVANADERPVWKSGDFFGTMFSRKTDAVENDSAAGRAR